MSRSTSEPVKGNEPPLRASPNTLVTGRLKLTPSTLVTGRLKLMPRTLVQPLAVGFVAQLVGGLVVQGWATVGVQPDVVAHGADAVGVQPGVVAHGWATVGVQPGVVVHGADAVGVQVGGVVPALHPVCAGFVRPIPWLRLHS